MSKGVTSLHQDDAKRGSDSNVKNSVSASSMTNSERRAFNKERRTLRDKEKFPAKTDTTSTSATTLLSPKTAVSSNTAKLSVKRDNEEPVSPTSRYRDPGYRGTATSPLHRPVPPTTTPTRLGSNRSVVDVLDTSPLARRDTFDFDVSSDSSHEPLNGNLNRDIR